MDSSKFILLEENVTGYGKGNTKPNGHITIAMPGIIKCYIQGLDTKDDVKYTLYLVSKGKNKAVRIGEINDPEENKQTIWKIDGSNIAGSGLSIKDIDCVAIVVEGITIGNTDVVLIGYTTNKYLISTLLGAALPKPVVKPIIKPIVKPTPDPTVKPGIPAVPGEGPGPVIIPTPDQPAVPGEGPGPVIIPTPDQPAVPGEGPGPVIIPTPDQPAVPGEGPGPVIIPTPDQPAVPGEGPGPVIIPTPDQPAVPGEGPGPVIIPTPDQPAVPGEGPGPVVMPTPDEGETPDGWNPEDGLGPALLPTDEKPQVPPPTGATINKLPTPTGATIGVAPEEEEETTEEDAEDTSPENKNLGEELKKILGLMSEQNLDKRQMADVLNEKIQGLLDDSFTKEDIVAEKAQLEAQIKALLSSELKMPVEAVVEEMAASEDEKEYLEELTKGLDYLKNKNCQAEAATRQVLEEAEENKQDEEDPLFRIRMIFDGSERIAPFEEDSEPIDWVRISMSELISIPQLSYEWCTQPFVTYCYHTYRHIILGKDKEIEQYYIGIPDKFNASRSSVLSLDKVERFKPCSGGHTMTDECGYWIIML